MGESGTFPWFKSSPVMEVPMLAKIRGIEYFEAVKWPAPSPAGSADMGDRFL
jgi:hypothetical protein